MTVYRSTTSYQDVIQYNSNIMKLCIRGPFVKRDPGYESSAAHHSLKLWLQLLTFLATLPTLPNSPNLKLTLSPSLVHTPCCTTPNSPVPSSLLTKILSAGMICLLGTRTGGLSTASSANMAAISDCPFSSFLCTIICSSH